MEVCREGRLFGLVLLEDGDSQLERLLVFEVDKFFVLLLVSSWLYLNFMPSSSKSVGLLGLESQSLVVVSILEDEEIFEFAKVVWNRVLG